MAAARDSKGNSASPQSKSPKPAKGKSSFTDIKFINFSLNDKQKELYDAWVSKGVDILSLADDTLRGGYKLSQGEDVSTGAVMCTITNRAGDPKFAMHCFTIRGRDYATALARLLYVHHIICEGDWSVIAEPDDADDAW